MVLGKVHPLVVVAALMASVSAQAEGTPPSPAAVLAVAAGEHVMVHWPPVDAPAAQYRVYGIDSGGAATHLDTASVPVALVEAGYDRYAVTTVVDGTESTPTYSSTGICLRLYETPPQVDTSCPSSGVYGTLRIPPLP